MTIRLVSPSLVETVIDLRTFNGANLINQHMFLVSALNGVPAWFRWTTGLTGTEDGQLLITPTIGSASGRFLRADSVVSLKLPYVATAANNTVLATIPTGMRFKVLQVMLQIGTQFTGADTGSIGIDSNISLNAGGLGLIVGNTAAAAGTFNGVDGAENTDPIRSVLIATNTIRHNVLAAGYTGGTGFWHVVGALLQT